MTQTQHGQEIFNAEKTFKAYTTEQGAKYAQARKGYHPNLYRRIIDHHTSTGGQLGSIVDVGCGPGTATEVLAASFSTAIGLDASEGMLATATSRGGVTATNKPIRFRQSSAEQLDVDAALTTDGTVDLITVATAAHWFDMSKFWPRAAQLLRPGGTVAIWTGRIYEVHSTVPNAEKINAMIKEFEERELQQYMESGNLIGHNLYRTLTLPWTLDPPVTEFDIKSAYRKEWGTPDGDDAETPGNEFYIENYREHSLVMAERGLSTGSPITRWREANPDKVGTKDDLLKMLIAEIARLLHEAGVPVGEEMLRAKVTAVLIMIKKRA